MVKLCLKIIQIGLRPSKHIQESKYPHLDYNVLIKDLIINFIEAHLRYVGFQ